MEQMIIITDQHKYAIFVEDDGEKIYGMEWVSPGLRKQLWKWGFVDKGRVYKYLVPPKKEQTVAILLYPRPCPLCHPLAIFGDKKLAEKLLFETEFLDDPNGIKGFGSLHKLMRLHAFGVKARIEGREVITGNELEPKKIFEGRVWLEKIMDAYEIALKEAEEKEKYYPGKPDPFNARLVFMTRDGDYWKEIGIDENTVFDEYIKSELLKAYFDELGLTKELLVGKSNKSPEH